MLEKARAVMPAKPAAPTKAAPSKAAQSAPAAKSAPGMLCAYLSLCYIPHTVFSLSVSLSLCIFCIVFFQPSFLSMDDFSFLFTWSLSIAAH